MGEVGQHTTWEIMMMTIIMMLMMMHSIAILIIIAHRLTWQYMQGLLPNGPPHRSSEIFPSVKELWEMSRVTREVRFPNMNLGVRKLWECSIKAARRWWRCSPPPGKTAYCRRVTPQLGSDEVRQKVSQVKGGSYAGRGDRVSEGRSENHSFPQFPHPPLASRISPPR